MAYIMDFVGLIYKRHVKDVASRDNAWYGKNGSVRSEGKLFSSDYAPESDEIAGE